MRRLFLAVWQRWKRGAEEIAHVQARLIFGLLYFLLVTPFALGVKIFVDPLGLRRGREHCGWQPLPRQTLRLEEARRQF